MLNQLSLHHSIVNITEFHLDIQLRPVHYLTSAQDNLTGEVKLLCATCEAELQGEV